MNQQLPGGIRVTQSGFTLLEIMVALAVVALGMAAAFSTVNQVAYHGSYLRDKTLANWIAVNKLAELRLENVWPEDGDEGDGELEFASQTWQWQAEFTATEVEDLRRIDVTVAHIDHPDDVLVTVTGFMGRNQIRDGAGTPWTGLAPEQPPEEDGSQ